MAVAKAATVLKVAKMIVEVLIDFAAANLNSFIIICWVAVWLAADWNSPFPDTLIFPCGLKFMSARDSNQPRPPPNSGDIGPDGSDGEVGDGDEP